MKKKNPHDLNELEQMIDEFVTQEWEEWEEAEVKEVKEVKEEEEEESTWT